MAVLSDANNNDEQKMPEIPTNPSESHTQKQEEKPENQPQDQKTKEKNRGLNPNKINGLDMENYSWGQSIQEVYINVSVPPGTKPAFITVLIKKNRITIGIKNQDPILDDDLFSGVIVDESFWSLEDKKTVTVMMTKQDRMDWWKSLLKGGPVIDTEMVEPGPSKLSELDLETRSALEKMLFDRRQKALGLPTSGQIINEELTKKLIAQNPIIDYSGKDFMKGAAE